MALVKQKWNVIFSQFLYDLTIGIPPEALDSLRTTFSVYGATSIAHFMQMKQHDFTATQGLEKSKLLFEALLPWYSYPAIVKLGLALKEEGQLGTNWRNSEKILRTIVNKNETIIREAYPNSALTNDLWGYFNRSVESRQRLLYIIGFIKLAPVYCDFIAINGSINDGLPIEIDQSRLILWKKHQSTIDEFMWPISNFVVFQEHWNYPGCRADQIQDQMKKDENSQLRIAVIEFLIQYFPEVRAIDLFAIRAELRGEFYQPTSKLPALASKALVPQQVVQEAPANNEDKTCVVCLDAGREMTGTCGHFCICQACSMKTKDCPICRQATNWIKIYHS